jgi:predicted metal-binding membrane protein
MSRLHAPQIPAVEAGKARPQGWLVMMAAMMLPAASPMVAAYGRRSAPAGATAAFAAGYLAAWVATGLLGYAVIEAVRSLDPAFLGWEEAGRYVAAGVIAAAGVFQLTTAKCACLRPCRARMRSPSAHYRSSRSPPSLRSPCGRRNGRDRMTRPS